MNEREARPNPHLAGTMADLEQAWEDWDHDAPPLLPRVFEDACSRCSFGRGANSPREPSTSRRARNLTRGRGLVRSRGRHDTGEVFELVKANQAHHRVATICRVLGISASGYYARACEPRSGWRGRGRSNRAKRDEELHDTVRTIHEASGGRYGIPRVHLET